MANNDILQKIIAEMETQKEYIADSKAEKRKNAKKNVAIDKCIEIVRQYMER